MGIEIRTRHCPTLPRLFGRFLCRCADGVPFFHFDKSHSDLDMSPCLRLDEVDINVYGKELALATSLAILDQSETR
jgi:hypothetical protein